MATVCSRPPSTTPAASAGTPPTHRTLGVRPFTPTRRRPGSPAPEQLSASESGTTSSELRWDPPSSPGDAPVDTYDVYRNGALVASVPASATAFTDDVSALPGGSEATYQVAATNIYGESNLSE